MTNASPSRQAFWGEVESCLTPGMAKRLGERGHDIVVARADGASLFGEDGKGYLDAMGGDGSFNLGHRHPQLVEALKAAARETDQGNFPMISREKAALAKALAHFAGHGLECVVFSVVRGETVEFACKIARGVSERQELVAFDGAWHGQTGFALTLSERRDKAGFGPLIPETRLLPYGDEKALRNALSSKTAAVLFEPVQVENHCRQADPEFCRTLRSLCDETGALLIQDESQTGFYRCGPAFVGRLSSLRPDLLVLGEALGGGLFPIAATVFTQDVNRFLNQHPMIHLSTFGGSDVGCRVALAALDVYRHEKLEDRVERTGKLLEQGLRKLQSAHPTLLLSVAGRGMVWSLKLNAPESALAFCREAAACGLLLREGKVDKTTVLLRPSLLLDDGELARLLAALNDTAGRLG